MSGLRNGETLRIAFSADVGLDVRVERHADPPRAYFQGRAPPLDRLDAVLPRIEAYLGPEGARSSRNGAVPARGA